MYDCVIVGAGPTGSYTAQKMAQSGLKVLILEEHKQVGLPVHCTGIVGENVIKNYDVPEQCIIRRIGNVKVHFPSGENVGLPTPIKPYLVDRMLFDQAMLNRAMANNAECLLASRVERIENRDNSVRIVYKNGGGEKSVESRLCVLAVGAMSSLPRTVGFSSCPGSYQSAQVEAEIEGINGIELFLGRNIAPGSFAYAVNLEGGRSKLGLIVPGKAHKCYSNLINSAFLKDRIVSLKESPVFRRMPFGIAGKTVSGRIMLVGDCASQLKTTTGGGIYYGLRCAGILADTIIDSYRGKDFDLHRLKRYHGSWKRELATELMAGMYLRGFLEKTGDEWWNMIPQILKSSEVKNLIANYSDFDHHYKFIFDFFRLPIARKFIFKLLKNNFLSAGIINPGKNNRNITESEVIGDKVLNPSVTSCFMADGIG